MKIKHVVLIAIEVVGVALLIAEKIHGDEFLRTSVSNVFSRFKKA